MKHTHTERDHAAKDKNDKNNNTHSTRWSQIKADVDCTAVKRPKAIEGVVKTKHMKSSKKSKLLLSRYKSTMVVLRAGRLSLYTIGRSAKADDRLSHELDFGAGDLFQHMYDRKLKFVTADGEAFELKFPSQTFRQWLDGMKQHQYFRVAEKSNVKIINSSDMTDDTSKKMSSLELTNQQRLWEQIEQVKQLVADGDKQLKHMTDSQIVLKQISDAMGNNHVKRALIFNQEYVTEAGKLQQIYRNLYNQLDKIIKSSDLQQASKTALLLPPPPKQLVPLLIPPPISDTIRLDSYNPSKTHSESSSDEESSTSDETSTKSEGESENEVFLSPENQSPEKSASPITISGSPVPISSSPVPTPTTVPPKPTIATTPALKQEKSISETEKAKIIKPTVVKTPTPTPIPAAGIVRRTRLPFDPVASAGGTAVLASGGKMPIAFYEPISMLQLLCEELGYSFLLEKAMACTDRVERMAYICAMAVSAYSDTAYRSRKPFNPLVGETYEFDRRADLGWRFFAEQVSHGPDISVAYSTAKSGWSMLSIAVVPRVQLTFKVFRTNRFAVTPLPPSGNTLILPKAAGRDSETYQWNKVTTHICDATSADRWVAHSGTMTVTASSGLSATIVFDPPSGDRTHRQVSGSIVDNTGKSACHIGGDWSKSIWMKKHGHGEHNKVTLYKVRTTMKQAQYGFTELTFTLNELTPAMVNGTDKLPPTDSRYRPDMRSIEENKMDEAHAFRMDLEQKQRDRKKNKSEFTPIWFREDTNSNKGWTYGFNYWTEKDKKFEGRKFPELFDRSPELDKTTK